MSEVKQRYSLSDNDLMIIKGYSKKPISENARKTLIILSEVFGGLHHLDSDQLELFDYQTTWYNSYLLRGGLATFDAQHLTLLVIMAHDMAVRLEIQAVTLDAEYDEDSKLLQHQLQDFNGDNDYKLTMEQYNEKPSPYIKLLFHQRKRDGSFSERHPTLEDTTQGFRDGNKRYV
jgi:hypothetical protein